MYKCIYVYKYIYIYKHIYTCVCVMCVILSTARIVGAAKLFTCTEFQKYLPLFTSPSPSKYDVTQHTTLHNYTYIT